MCRIVTTIKCSLYIKNEHLSLCKEGKMAVQYEVQGRVDSLIEQSLLLNGEKKISFSICFFVLFKTGFLNSVG